MTALGLFLFAIAAMVAGTSDVADAAAPRADTSH